MAVWDKVFKNGPRKICGRQPLKNMKGYGLLPMSVSADICILNMFHD